MARKIAFVNYKGGVGKTSCIVNVAAAVAKRGHRVLLFDLDTQSNSSIWLMRLERWNMLNNNGKGSVYSIFEPGTDRLKDILIKDVVESKDGRKLLPGLDLIPTTFNLIDVEHEYVPPPGKPPFVTFQEQLEEIQDDYDYIFFDCPPNVMRASQCGLFPANEVYVPSNPDALSLIGLTLLVGKLQQFNERSASFRRPGMGKPATVQGVIFNAIKANMDIQVPKMRMQFRINQFRNQRRIGPRAKIFPQEIRDAVIVRRAVTLGLPVCLLDDSGSEADGVGQDYNNLATQIIRHGDLINT